MIGLDEQWLKAIREKYGHHDGWGVYQFLGSKQPEDVELLCSERDTGADEARSGKGRPMHEDAEEGLIVGADGDQWGKLDPNTIYIPLQDGRYIPVPFHRKGRS